MRAGRQRASGVRLLRRPLVEGFKRAQKQIQGSGEKSVREKDLVGGLKRAQKQIQSY
jgi:hypothetical protein